MWTPCRKNLRLLDFFLLGDEAHRMGRDKALLTLAW